MERDGVAKMMYLKFSGGAGDEDLVCGYGRLASL